MKKILVCIFAISVVVQSCKRDEIQRETIKEVESLTEQNTNDDKAIEKFLTDHYFDNQGLIQAFTSDTSDDHYPKLSQLNPVKLPSGVIVIKRENAQPNDANAKTIKQNDELRLMSKTTTFLSQKNNDGTISYITGTNLTNTVDTWGIPEKDPYYYYVRNSILTNATTEASKKRNYYEIEGFQEGLKHFKAFNNLPDSESYNMQGAIIVPSRVAYARDAHYLSSFRNATFVFNFQVYSTSPRTND